MTFAEELWRAKWGILFILAFAGVIGLAFATWEPNTSTRDECEAKGGHMVIPRLDERQPQPDRYKRPPGLICKIRD